MLLPSGEFENYSVTGTFNYMFCRKKHSSTADYLQVIISELQDYI